MTSQEWLAEVERRIAISEGSRSVAYRDSLGILTIGIGFNLERADARDALADVGVSASAIPRVLAGTSPLTQVEIGKLFAYSFAPILSDARASLAAGIFDDLDDPRRFVVCDLVFNVGAAGWMGFANTRCLLNLAQSAKNAGAASGATLFMEAADHLAESAWYGQVGDRAKRDVAMMRTSLWCNPYGDGSDVA